MRRSIVLLSCALALGFASTSSAAEIVIDNGAYLLVNGQILDFGIELIPKKPDNGNGADMGATFEFKTQKILINGEDELTINGGGNTDPHMSLGVVYIDFGAPSSFSTALVAPIGPVLFGPVTLSATHSGSWTDGGDRTISFVTGGPGTGPSTSRFDINGSFISPALNLGPGFVDTGTGGTYPASGGEFAATVAFDCTAVGGCSSMKIEISGTGSGGGDLYTLNAGLDVTPVPEPGTLTLLGLGLVAAAYRLRRR